MRNSREAPGIPAFNRDRRSEVREASGLPGLVDSCYHAARVARHVEFARLVLPDRSQIAPGRGRDVRPGPGAATLPERPNAAADEISKNVTAGEGRYFLAVVDVAADHGRVPLGAVVIENGIGRSAARWRAGSRERMAALAK